MMLTLCSSNSLHHLVERAGAVLQRDPQPRQAARAGEVAQQHVGEQARVDVAAAQHEAELACPRTARGAPAPRRAPPRPRPRPRSFRSAAAGDRVFERGFARPAGCRRPRSAITCEVNSPGSLTAMPSASVSPPHGRSCAVDLLVHRREQRGLDADDLDRAAGSLRAWPRSPCPRSARRRRSAPPACRSRARRRAFRAPPCPARRRRADRRTDGRRSARARFSSWRAWA